MLSEEAKQQIERALIEWESANSAGAAKPFLMEQLRSQVTHLISMSEAIRTAASLSKSKDWRQASNMTQSLLAIGQGITSMLFYCNLNRSISDPIEYSYGIRFNALVVCPEAIDLTDGGKIFILHPLDHMRPEDKAGVAKNGAWMALERKNIKFV